MAYQLGWPRLVLTMGAQEGLWSWLSGVTDNSLYPVMLAANLSLWIKPLGEEGWPRT